MSLASVTSTYQTSSGGEEVEKEDKKKRKKKPNKNTTATKKKNENKSPDIVFKQPQLIRKTNPTKQNNIEKMEIDNVNEGASTSGINPTILNKQQQTNLSKEKINNTPKNNHKNYSPKMNDIKNMEYANLFYINTENMEMERTQMSNIWSSKFPNSKDVILKTKLGFILKSNKEKKTLEKTLEELKNEKKIVSYKETTSQKTTNERRNPQQTYSVVIAAVELSIKEEEISQHLTSNNIKHRYCKRIISRAFAKPTRFIRIITGEVEAFESLLNNGFFYLNRHYLVYPSHPPEPTPIPCNRCLKFDHKTENCISLPKCPKCQGPHKMSQCKSNNTPKCLACGKEDHMAWSIKCPNHPKKPIEGIPNMKIKTLNKKTRDIDDLLKKTNRIHVPITIHDHIINTYSRKMNKPKNTDRNELVIKLKKRFINEFNVDTTVVFSGNRFYVLIFDLEEPDEPSPTEPISNEVNKQVHVDN